MNWKFFASMAVGMLESAGIAKTMEDENTTGTDDIMGEGLIYASKLIRWLLAGGPKSDKPAPTVPSALK